MKALLVILAAFTLAQIPLLGHTMLWDEAVFMGMGKYIYSAGQSGLWEPIRPIGMPILLGLGWSAQLPYPMYAAMLSLAFSLAALTFTYLIAQMLFNRKTAVLATILLGTSWIFFFYSSLVFTEIPSLTVLLAALYFTLRKRLYIAGALAGIAVLFKFTSAAIIPAIGILLAWQLRNNLKAAAISFGKFLAGLAAAIAPFLALNALMYGNAIRPFVLASWHQFNPAKYVENPLQNALYYIIQGKAQHIAFILLIPAIYFYWKKWHESGKIAMALYFAAFLAYFTLIPNKDSRFLITFLPAICIITAAAFFEIAAMPRKAAGKLLYVASIGIVAASLAISVASNLNFYGWRMAETSQAPEPYTTLAELGIKGPVLTSDPVFAAYNNNLFIPYYDTSSGIALEVKPSWNAPYIPVQAVIFSEESLYCGNGDIICYIIRSTLKDKIAERYDHAHNGTYFNETATYYFFVNKTYSAGK